MAETGSTQFEVNAFLANAGLGRRIIQVKKKGVLFSQGHAARLRFLPSEGSRETRCSFPAAARKPQLHCFLPETSLERERSPEPGGLRLATAVATTACTVLKIERSEMVRVLHEEQAFTDVFVKFLLARSLRIQADLVDQLFNSSEKRLARLLLLMAEFRQTRKMRKR